jgi:hypothetical protein
MSADRREWAGAVGRRSTLGIAIAALCLTLLPVRMVLADHGDDRGRSHRDDDRGHRDMHRRGHRYRVYAPPTVYYPQVVSPGIRLVIPIEIH